MLNFKKINIFILATIVLFSPFLFIDEVKALSDSIIKVNRSVGTHTSTNKKTITTKTGKVYITMKVKYKVSKKWSSIC